MLVFSPPPSPPRNRLSPLAVRKYIASEIGCLRHFVYSKFRIFRMFFLFRIPFENGPNFAKLYEIFLCKSIQNSAVFREILWLVIPIFLTIQHRRHFLHTAEKLQDADWGWGRYDSTPLNPYPFTAASRVFTTFRILEISYISNVFFCFVYHSKMAQISRNYMKFFYAKLYKIPR